VLWVCAILSSVQFRDGTGSSDCVVYHVKLSYSETRGRHNSKSFCCLCTRFVVTYLNLHRPNQWPHHHIQSHTGGEAFWFHISEKCKVWEPWVRCTGVTITSLKISTRKTRSMLLLPAACWVKLLPQQLELCHLFWQWVRPLLQAPCTQTGYGSHAFSSAVPAIWKKLPTTVLEANSLFFVVDSRHNLFTVVFDTN